MSREPSTSQGERARRVVETAVGTRTCSKDAREEQQRRRRERQRERLAAETDAQTERGLSQRRQRDRARRAAQTARYAILSQRYSPSLERHSMEPPPSQMTVLGWTDVAAIGFRGSPFERALFDVRVFNPYAPSNRQPLIAKARPTMLAFRLVF